MLKISRRKSLGLLALGGMAGAVADAFMIEPKWLSITRRDILVKDLPAGLDGFKIAQITDPHFVPGKDEGLMEKWLEAVNDEQVDLVALTGDYVVKDKEAAVPFCEGIARLQAKHGMVAVMGNHDGWSAPSSYFRKLFEKAGSRFLVNQHTRYELGGESLVVAGTDYVWLGKPDIARACRGVSPTDKVLALVHEPDYFDVVTSHRDVMLQLSGHTHGGQCRVPFLGYAPVSVEHGRNYIYGEYRQGDSQLFVSRGIGMTGIRVRFACRPELAVLTLRSEG